MTPDALFLNRCGYPNQHTIMKHPMWLLLAIPAVLGLLALTPLQDPEDANVNQDVTQRVRFSVIQYVDGTGKMVEVAARDLVELKVHPATGGSSTTIELYYDNGDYSMVTTPTFHVIRRSAVPNQEISMVRTNGSPESFTFPGIR